MSTSKPKKKIKQSQPDLPKELADKVSALVALVSVERLLLEGLYPFEKRFEIDSAIKFLNNLHKPLLEEAILHPDAIRVPGLVEEIKRRSIETNKKQDTQTKVEALNA